jgi:hypothetical protein
VTKKWVKYESSRVNSLQGGFIAGSIHRASIDPAMKRPKMNRPWCDESTTLINRPAMNRPAMNHAPMNCTRALKDSLHVHLKEKSTIWNIIKVHTFSMWFHKRRVFKHKIRLISIHDICVKKSTWNPTKNSERTVFINPFNGDFDLPNMFQWLFLVFFRLSKKFFIKNFNFGDVTKFWCIEMCFWKMFFYKFC